jgi:hypothetical protein
MAVGAVLAALVAVMSLPQWQARSAESRTALLSPERRGLNLLDIAPRKARPPLIQPLRSLAVTDKDILDGFTFAEVLARLAEQSGEPELTPSRLFKRWWATQLPADDEDFGAHGGPSCMDPLYGRPYDCPRVEGKQVKDDPFIDHASGSAYIPIGLFNRYDLAASDGSDCGEYRIIFARRSGLRDERVLINFEAVLPNPTPNIGRAGCRPIVEFWASTTTWDVRSVPDKSGPISSWKGRGSCESFDSSDHAPLASVGFESFRRQRRTLPTLSCSSTLPNRARTRRPPRFRSSLSIP